MDGEYGMVVGRAAGDLMENENRQYRYISSLLERRKIRCGMEPPEFLGIQGETLLFSLG
jgi:hypothetical protein